jgi:hypothetical protein
MSKFLATPPRASAKRASTAERPCHAASLWPSLRAALLGVDAALDRALQKAAAAWMHLRMAVDAVHAICYFAGLEGADGALVPSIESQGASSTALVWPALLLRISHAGSTIERLAALAGIEGRAEPVAEAAALAFIRCASASALTASGLAARAVGCTGCPRARRAAGRHAAGGRTRRRARSAAPASTIIAFARAEQRDREQENRREVGAAGRHEGLFNLAFSSRGQRVSRRMPLCVRPTRRRPLRVEGCCGRTAVHGGVRAWDGPLLAREGPAPRQ